MYTEKGVSCTEGLSLNLGKKLTVLNEDDLLLYKLIADHYDEANPLLLKEEAETCYKLFISETIEQFKFIQQIGVKVLPWKLPNQPYQNYTELKNSFKENNTIYVYMTKNGYGNQETIDSTSHPMLNKSTFNIDGELFLFNDLFRCVHDFFGHIVPNNSFKISGELNAAHYHMHMYTCEARRAVFSETVAQICWFYYGPHLRDNYGKLYPKNDKNFTPFSERIYSPQKPVIFPKYYIEYFNRLFIK